ncbi:MAG: hypothetical protein HRT88_20435, partial [Lentisphaeraceae bacterium]|nr:hypothetical protein [Lentisphaeraceae bacterium]
MRHLFYSLLFLSFSLIAQSNKNHHQFVNKSLFEFSQAVQSGDLQKARSYIMVDKISDESISQLAEVTKKLQAYVKGDVISGNEEGLALYSFQLKNVAIYLTRDPEDSVHPQKWYFTEGTSSNITNIQIQEKLLDTPEKTIDYFLKLIEDNNFSDAESCFVSHQSNSEKNKEHYPHFATILKTLRSRNITAKFQKKRDGNAFLVSYPLGTESVSLVKENGDWLFTVYTRKHISKLYNEDKQNRLKSIIPKNLQSPLLGLKSWQWLGVIIILVIGVFVQWIF